MTTTAAGTLVDLWVFASLRSLAIGLVVFGLLRALRVETATVRHAAWRIVLVSMLLMPVLPAALWFIELPVTVPARLALGADRPEPMPQSLDAAPLSTATVEGPATASVAAPSEVSPIAMDSPQPSLVVQGFAMLLLCTYIGVVLGLLGRLLLGWAYAREVYRSSTAIAGLDGAYESACVAAPLTIGVLSPRILLPVDWRRWSSDMLEAVLVHERTHISRRDSLTAVLAHLNACVFWFHPMSWWIRRELALTAELACDAASVRTTGRPRQYAETLLAIAEAVRRRGARVALQGIGVDGTGALGKRIDRILRGDHQRSTSSARKALVVIGCVGVVLVAVACRPRIAPMPLQENVEFAKQRAQQKADRDADAALRAMTPRQVAALEAAVAANPEELDARRKLLAFYGPDTSGKRRPTEDEIIVARRRHILWLIEHHPEHELAGERIARIYPTPKDWQADPVGYELGKKLWLAYAARPNVHGRAIANAAGFFESADKPLAEQMLLRCQSLLAAQPGSDASLREYVSSRLADLYYQILVGSNAATFGRVIRSFSLEDAHGPLAASVRQKLIASRDVTLLAQTAAALIWSAQDPGSAYPPNMHVDFSTFDLGRQYLERAASLDAKSPHVVRAQASLRNLEYSRRFRAAVGGGFVPSAAQADRVAKLPEADRLAFMPFLAEAAYMGAESHAYSKRDEAGAREKYEFARRYAEDTLRLAERLPNAPERASAVFRAKIALATLNLREGDRKESLRMMRDAVGEQPASRYQPGYLWSRLATTLLNEGEREPVIELLDYLARIDDVVAEAESHRQAAAAIRAGRMPLFYQGATTAQ
jgi:beta-lactamase regulating signal transducer with metallopeptidase domain